MTTTRSTKDRTTWFSDRLDEARIRMARPNALVSLAMLGLITGIVAGGVIVLFRLLVAGAQQGLLPAGVTEAFESLDFGGRILFPLVAALLLAAMFRWFSRGIHVLGVAHVLERMHLHQGRIRLRAFFLQFFGAALAIIGGHSVGREGPIVFLGAASGSLLGTRLMLPHNVIRTLAGCGTAAGIAASFNTPLAGVVFALEVVMMEYSVSSFIPVILAAVSATALSNAVFGDFPSFVLPSMHLGSLWELVPVLVLGVVAGTVSAAFIQSVQAVTTHSRRFPLEARLVMAGILAGGFGCLVPEVMGIGYDSVSTALHGGYAVPFLLLLLVAKLLATSCCIGLGVPGGTIGPTLFIGAMLGAIVGELAAWLPFIPDNEAGLFALLGMGAMMAGSLQAPLAALTAMLELTDNSGIILPGMLVVVISGLTASEVFGKESQFLTMLRSSGLQFDSDPVSQAMRRIGVASVMDRRLVQVGKEITLERAKDLVRQQHRFLLVSPDNKKQLRRMQVLMPMADLVGFLESGIVGNPDEKIDLMEIPARRFQAATIGLQANLQEASAILGREGIEALVVKRRTRSGIHRVFGALTPEMVEAAYRF